MVAGNLGRRIPSDWEHVDKYPVRLALERQEIDKPTPVVIGVNWYTGFDRPVKDRDGRYWVGKDPHNLGSLRGGHCVCLKPTGLLDPLEWWRRLDQGAEGACVGFGSTRAMMLLNRHQYDPHWLYAAAQLVDEWEDTPPEEGTSVRAAMDILRDLGHRRTYRTSYGHTVTRDPNPEDGIAANRWATTVDQVLECLRSPYYIKRGAVGFLNSWGKGYPHITYMPGETLQRLLDEYGEATIMTDR